MQKGVLNAICNEKNLLLDELIEHGCINTKNTIILLPKF